MARGMTLLGVAVGMMAPGARGATFLSKFNRAKKSVLHEAYRRRILFPEDVEGATDAKQSATGTRNDEIQAKDSLIMGTIPMIQFQYRSHSFWSWRGGEESTSDDITTARPSMKESSSSSSATSSQKDTSSIAPIYGNRRYQVSCSTEQGFRSYMEDEYFISKNGDFCCCFDGHGGRAVSRYLRKNLYANVQAFLPVVALSTKLSTVETNKNDSGDETNVENDSSTSSPKRPSSLTVEDYASALESALDKIDKEILRISHWSYQGSTAVVVWLHEERTSNTDDLVLGGKVNKTILVANIGDSRAVLCRNNTAWNLTRDHKPSDPSEMERIKSLGGSVIWSGDVDILGMPIEERGIYRVNGNLALSRAIGDRAERPHVTAEPEITAVPVEDDDEFIILATDGLWDVMDSAVAVSYVKFALDAGLSRGKVASQMVQEALRRGTYDNITVIIIWL